MVSASKKKATKKTGEWERCIEAVAIPSFLTFTVQYLQAAAGLGKLALNHQALATRKSCARLVFTVVAVVIGIAGWILGIWSLGTF